MMIARLLSKVENMERVLLNNTNSEPKKLDPSFIGQFPICNNEQFLCIETQLQDDEEFVSKLV